MATPLVSVKMITYNHEPYIRQAIDCVLNQKTNFPFELVIGEDCSTDSTREIVFDYAKRYPDIIRVITSEQNVGMKQNSKRTSDACRGKYIAICEGDDYWQRDDKLQMQVDYMERHPECGLIYSDYNRHYVKQNLIIPDYLHFSKRIPDKSPDIQDIIMNKVEIRTCTVLLKKELILKIIESDPFLFQSEHFKMGDTQLWAEISLHSKIYYINESLATYRILENSASQNKDITKKLQFDISCSEMFCYLCDKHKMPEYIKKPHEDNMRRYLLKLAFLESRIDSAEAVKKSFKNFSWKDWIWFYGTKSKLLNAIIKTVQIFR